MARRKLPNLADRYLLRVCEMFLEGAPAAQIAKWVNTESRKEGRVLDLTREQIYPLLHEARKRGYFTIQPPLHLVLSQRLADLYRVKGRDDSPIAVVNAMDLSALDHVAAEAAAVALRVIKKLVTVKNPVHIGLGAGFTSLRMAHHLAALLRAEPTLPRLVLHALSTGFRVDQPHIAPVAFFSLFDALSPKVGYVGLFSPAIVSSQHYDAVKREPGVAESFAAAGDIDVILTSLASASDEHGALNQFLADHVGDVEGLKQAGWIGDLQYRPYSRQGPIVQEAHIRAVTLFDLPDLVTLAQTPHKSVIVAAGPCGQCGRTRTDALYPLLTEPSLKVWTHLVVDFTTAQELVALAP
jgi:DNA-binding transcriptional regulator LsrR (DeoR family)